MEAHVSTLSTVAGETLHVIGKDGVERAKAWLEKTGKVQVNFLRYQLGEAPFLTFQNDSGSSFSFDLGGILNLEGGNAQFFGEVKKVSGESGQGGLNGTYHEYLAKCYKVSTSIDMPAHFMWITWHPFSQSTWSALCDAATVVGAVNHHKETYCAAGEVDEDLCAALAERLWLIVLSDRQEKLSMSDAMLGEVRAAIVRGVTV